MENLPFEIVTKNGYHAIKNENSSVAVLVYTLDDNEILDKVGVVIEQNPHFHNNTYTGIILGTVEPDDPSLLSRARAELLEESGYAANEINRWEFLGELYTSKLFTESIYCYAVDVTGIEPSPPPGDGSSQEKNIKFVLLPLNRARLIPDSILQTCFFKLFSTLYKNQFAS